MCEEASPWHTSSWSSSPAQSLAWPPPPPAPSPPSPTWPDLTAAASCSPCNYTNDQEGGYNFLY